MSDNTHPLADDEVLHVQEEGITVTPGTLARLDIRLDCGNGVARHMSARAAEDYARALVLAARASRAGQRVDQ